jgi:hypothetical protein
LTKISIFEKLLYRHILKKRQDINFKALSLLLVYLISNSPSILFHHHASDSPSYEHATPCEKTIYYSNKGSSCHHKAHISKAAEKCFLCDNHTISPHAPQAYFFYFFNSVKPSVYSENNSDFYSSSPSLFANRGPPSVSSHTV